MSSDWGHEPPNRQELDVKGFAWEPINLHGEYDFGEDVLKDALILDWEKLLSFEISSKP